MAVDFSAFDKKVDLDALQEEVKNADLSSFEDVPDGKIGRASCRERV